MQTVFRLNADELNEQFLESVRATFPHKEIEIAVAEVDETAHLLRSDANRERLIRALADVEAGRNLVTLPSGHFE
jgi:antitoxin YefM